MKKNQPIILSVISLSIAIAFSTFIWVLSEKTQSITPPKVVKEVIKKIVMVDPNANPNQHAKQAKKLEIETRFNQAVLMLHAKDFDNAIKSLHRVLELAPKMPEAHVNMGYAFLGGGDAKTARDFFASAMELNLNQLNAYYGLAVASEALGDMESALGAMQTYVHLSPKGDPNLTKARAA
ncbi:hypothetical protein MNBD_GAMMA04-1981, partial [hydrothermal vent metagenome]